MTEREREREREGGRKEGREGGRKEGREGGREGGRGRQCLDSDEDETRPLCRCVLLVPACRDKDECFVYSSSVRDVCLV